MKGRFTAVVHGEFETSSGARPVLVAVLLGAAALVSWLMTILVDLAIATGSAAAVVIAACWLLLRRNDRDAELLAERAAALQAEATGTRPVAVVHYHVHLPPGADAAGIIQALPQRGAVTEEE